jgi:hypothetical protein
MSWYGAHPTLTKREARELLPVGACKRCVYWVRVHGRPGKPQPNMKCYRCAGDRALRPPYDAICRLTTHI